MFKPKIYKSNGLEAYHLINDEGGDFLYEGSVEYSEQELFKDEQGRAFYLVTTEIGGTAKYYVEVEPEGTRIPVATAKKEKDISDLVMASPRDETAPAEHEQEPSPETSKPPEAFARQRDTCFESPEKVPEKAVEPAREPPVAPKPEQQQPTTADEAKAAVKAMASLGEHKPKKKFKLFSLPVILALIIVVILVAATPITLVTVYKPGLVSGLNIPYLSTPTPTPTPTPVPTPLPTPEATPTPTPEGGHQDLYNSLLAIGPAIDANNTSVACFTTNHTNEAGGIDNRLAKACDLYNYVNGHWVITAGSGTPQYAGSSVGTMKGDDRDNAILMASITQVLGFDSRVVAAYDGNRIRYYPEILVANNDSSYTDAKNYLRGRYNVTDPYFHIKGNEYWLSMATGAYPGIKVNATDEYFADWRGTIAKI